MSMHKQRTGLLVPALLALAVSMGAQARDGNEAALLELVVAGDTRAALERIGRRTDVNVTAEDGSTPLHWAAYYNDAELVKALLRRGAEVNVRNQFNATPLAQAAQHGNAAVIAMLLAEGADPNEKGADEQTPLMLVARTGHLDAAEVLIEAGADVNAVETWRGQTALMWAAAQQQPAMVALLLEAGADPDAQSWPNDFERQVTAEPRIKVLPEGGLTPLMYAAREGCADCVAALIAGGASLDKADANEVTPLLLANLNAHWDTAKVLIEGGANVNKWDWWGRTPLYAAVDLNTVPRGGRADLPSTDRTSGVEIISLLLEKGANPDAQLKLFPPYRALGADRGADNILTVGATPLHRAARGADLDAMTLLLEHGANADLPTMAEITPLMTAAGLRASAIDTRGRLRSENQAYEATELLLQHGVDVNYQERFGQTALHGAASQGYTSIVQLLLDHGADITLEDQSGNTALDVAMGRGGSFGRGTGGGTVHAETGALLQRAMDELQ